MKFFDLIKKIFSKKRFNISENDMVKSHITSYATLTLSNKLELNKEKIKYEVECLIKENIDNLQNLLDYIKDRGTKVYFIKNAPKYLKLINEEDGIIFGKIGFSALFLNILTKEKLSFKTKAMFIFEDEPINKYNFIYSFYKWYSFISCLPGFEDELNQKLKTITKDEIKKLNFSEVAAFEQAIARDKEAVEFVLDFIKKSEGAKNAFDVLKNGENGTGV